MKQTKQMEFRVRKEEEKLKKAGDQLLAEAERSNETIMQQKRNEKFRLEKAIETVKNKTEQIKPIDVEYEKTQVQKELEKQ